MAYKYSPPAGAALGTTRADLQDEIRRWNDQAGVNVAVLDLPSSYPATKRDDQVAAITLHLRGVTVPIRVDRWGDFAVNFRCCYLVLRDMRLSEARGVEQAAAAAYAALLPAAKTQRDPWEVLGLRPGASAELIDNTYRFLARGLHPDAGGSDEAMAELNDARDRAKATLTPPPAVTR